MKIKHLRASMKTSGDLASLTVNIMLATIILHLLKIDYLALEMLNLN